MQYPRALMNTVIITVCSVAGIIIVSAMCGYALNRKGNYRLSKMTFTLLLSGMLFPYQMSILGLLPADTDDGINESFNGSNPD